MIAYVPTLMTLCALGWAWFTTPDDPEADRCMMRFVSMAFVVFCFVLIILLGQYSAFGAIHPGWYVAMVTAASAAVWRAARPFARSAPARLMYIVSVWLLTIVLSNVQMLAMRDTRDLMSGAFTVMVLFVYIYLVMACGVVAGIESLVKFTSGIGKRRKNRMVVN